MIILDAPAAPIKRCPQCGVLARDPHVCDPATRERFEREARRAEPLTLENAHA